MIPGELFPAAGEVTLNEGRPTEEVEVRNTGDRPIQVGSHCHFFEVNRALQFNRGQAYGFRLDIPAGTAVRFEPGEERSVKLVGLAGRRLARGVNSLAVGPLDDVQSRLDALERASRYAL